MALNQQANGKSFKYILMIYVSVIIVFALLFLFSFSNTGDLKFVDSLFLSTSALSVTGLTSINIGSELTTIGQVLLMIEMQLGGMGILILISYLFLMMGKRITMSNMLLMSKDQNQSNLKTIKRLSFLVLIITVVIEMICFVFIYGEFRKHLGDGAGTIFKAMFHSVASFTNAGFTLVDLSVYQTNHTFLLVTASVVLLGSIGFPTIVESITSFRKRKSLFTRINIRMHMLLLAIGSVLYLAFEYNKEFSDFNPMEKVTNAIFLSANARSGGLAVVDVAELSLTTLLILICLMFIGGASSSTAGGIRLTTFRVLIAKMVSVAKSRKYTFIGKSNISDETVNKSFLVFSSFILFIMLATILLSITENRSLDVIIFEVVSALTNTGLSMGITAELTSISKIILVLLMIIGRIGIFTLVYVVFKVEKSKVKYLDEELAVG